MTATLTPVTESAVRRLARGVLTAAVRGRRERGGPWGEAVLGEFDRTSGNLEAIRWVAGGLRAVWIEHRGRIRELPRRQRLSRRWVLIALVTIGSVALVNQYVLTTRFMPSGSMEPTLQVGDRWLVDKVGFRVTGLHHGDVVSYTSPIDGAGHRSYPFAKRVIGLPGDTISCRDGIVFRDGIPVDEPYLPADRDQSRTDCTPVVVPDGELYLLGDHRLVSQDSRQDGPVSIDDIEGRRLFTLWRG
jgi:signal peptidase I